jgi:hypothetical protein
MPLPRRACWAHVYAATGSPFAADMLARLGALYDIEAAIRGHSGEARRAIRQTTKRGLCSTS